MYRPIAQRSSSSLRRGVAALRAELLAGERLVFGSRGVGLATAITVVFLGLTTLWSFGYLFPPINHDVGAILDVSRRWLGGERLYVDVIDMNLPLVFALHALPVVLASATDMSVPVAFVLCVLVAVLAAVLTFARLLEPAVPAARPLSRTLALWLCLFMLAVFPGENFGQREHLMLVAAMPYLALAAARAAGRPVPWRLAAGVALAAGLGFAMKPQFAAMPALVELGVLLSRPSLRQGLRDPVPWIIGAAYAGHAALLFLLTPDYLTRVLPLVLADYMDLAAGGPWAVAGNRYGAPTLVALVPLAAAAFALSGCMLARMLVLFAIGAVASYVMQGKGWDYHAVPMIAATLMSFGVLFAEFVDRMLLADRPSTRLPVTSIAAVVMALAFYQDAMNDPPFDKQFQHARSDIAQLAEVIRQNAYGGRVLVLSPGIKPIFPAVNYGNASLVGPFLSMWVLQGEYRECEEETAAYNDPDSMSDAEKSVFEAIPQALERQRPALVIVDRVPGIPWCNGREFNYVSYFSQNPAFAEQWKEYKELTEIDRFLVYKRHPLLLPGP